MIVLKNRKTGTINRTYICTPRQQIELCFANIECLLHIALADPDEHIKQLGGERELLELMNGYMDLAERMKEWGD